MSGPALRDLWVDAFREVLPPDLSPDLARWRLDPFAWARERLGVGLQRWADYGPEVYAAHAWDGTEEPLWTAAKALAEGQSCAVSSAIATGKTFLAAALVLWFLDCWPGGQVVTLAPKEQQLTLHIWKELGRLWPKFKALHPGATLDQLRIRMREGFDDWGAVGFVCGVGASEEVAAKARGFHAEHQLFIHEEVPGIDDAILEAIALTCTAPHNLRLYLGNPDSCSDALARVSAEPGVVAIRASALDFPNVVLDDASLVPGAVSRQVLDLWRVKYGEQDRLFQSRARGIAPAEARDALIRREWVVAAMGKTEDERKVLRSHGPAAVGVDCANSESGDKAAYAYGIGGECREVTSMPCPDVNAWARLTIYPFIHSGMVRARRVGIDSVGVGVGAVNELKRLGNRVQGLNAGSAPWEDASEPDESFRNFRSQSWWALRKDLQAGRIALPDDPELAEDLCSLGWEPKNGRIVVEEKAQHKKRLPGGRSPDKGDAVVLWNWIRAHDAMATFSEPSVPVCF